MIVKSNNTHNPKIDRPIPETPGTDIDTRERLLDAATSLFAEKGIAATRMAEIALRGGVTSAMIHYYFKTRDSLLDTFIEERIERASALIFDPITGDEDNPIAMVKDLVNRIIKTCDMMPWLPSIWMREIVNEGGALREKMLQRIPNDKLEMFMANIAKGQKKGVINPDIDPRLLTSSIIGLTMLPMATAKLWDLIPTLKGLDKTNIACHVKALIINGLTNTV